MISIPLLWGLVLSVTLSTGFFTIASSTSRSLTPMAAPGGLGQLTLALRFVRGRKSLRDRRRLHVGFGPELIGHLEGDSNQVGSLLAIFGAARIRFDALK